jgi:predicted NUDIX family NTP pyrophosphohydrolase
MSLTKKVHLIIYRFRERGLEVFLINNEQDGESWEIPQGKPQQEQPQYLLQTDKLIELDPIQHADGNTQEAWAVEGDWHEIPSLKSMLYEDAMQLKDKIQSMDKGTFFAVKEAFKKVMPNQYEFLKELKDILLDRHSIRDL